MKRTGLKRTAGLSRATRPPQRRRALSPNPDKVRAFLARNRGRGFRERQPLPPEVVAEAYARSGNRCINCQAPGRYLHAHHFLAVQHFPELQILADNVGAVCPRCHMNHHYAPHGRITWDRLPAVTVALATREGPKALAYLERTYPKRETSDA